MWIKITIAIGIKMNESSENPRRYKWPWFVLAGVLLFVVLTIVWMSFAVKRERQERDVNAPVPAGAK
jgi:membrane protein DedA with SNARE-associated domain